MMPCVSPPGVRQRGGRHRCSYSFFRFSYFRRGGVGPALNPPSPPPSSLATRMRGTPFEPRDSRMIRSAASNGTVTSENASKTWTPSISRSGNPETRRIMFARLLRSSPARKAETKMRVCPAWSTSPSGTFTAFHFRNLAVALGIKGSRKGN